MGCYFIPIHCVYSVMMASMTPMKIYKKVMRMAKKQDKKMKQQHSGTTARTAGTTARVQKAAREKLKNQATFQAAVLPLVPAVLPPTPETVVPQEVPLLLPAHPKTLLDPQRYLPGIDPVLPPASKIIKLQVAAVLPPLVSGTTVPFRSGTTATHQRYYRWHSSISG